MSMPFTINGARTVIPGVYDTFRVEGSLPAPVPAGRTVCIFGEATEGVPGTELDLRLNRYTSFEDVKDFYRSGPIVDAARQLFSNQPSPVFPGAIAALYVHKTNDSSRAEKTIAAPSGYGDLVAARYGELGNQIKSQILESQSETLPTKTFLYLPSPAARNLRVVVNGVTSAVLAMAADEVASDFVTDANAVAGLSATGGTVRTTNVASVDVDLTASGDVITITKTAGVGDFGTAAQVGDVLYIKEGSAIAGGSDENAGAYLIESWSATVITARQLKHIESSAEANVVAFDTVVGATVAVGDLLANAPVVFACDGATPVGAGATLEILEDSADKLALGMWVRYADFANILADSTSTIAQISTSIPVAGKLTVTLDTGSWSTIPSVGDVIRIPRGSLIAGATNKNVGLFVVESANSQSVTMAHLFAGMTTEAVAAVALNASNDELQWATGFVSSSVDAKRIDSSAERKVKIRASRNSDGATLPEDLIGGNPCLEIGYYKAVATACTVSISSRRVMTISPTGTGLNDIVINLRKYATLQDLVDFLSTQDGVSAQIPDLRFRSLSTDVLDAVDSLGCLDGHADPAYDARIKKDYYDWGQFFEKNFSLLAFSEGNLVLKAGLPDAEATAGFLSGAELGSTSNAACQAALDAALKIDARIIIPLFSRNAHYDIEDALTDSGSSYTIDSINAAVKAHVSTASSTLFKRERFGMTSYDGSFEDSVNAVATLSYERCQMPFQRHNALNGAGELEKFQPWMAACSVAAGRSQSLLGTSMLRKPFLLSSAEHVGQLSMYTDTLAQDFDPEDRGQLEEAIASGLLVFRSVPGFGVRMESPDLSTRSRDNDPKAWVYERVNVLFTCDEVRQTVRSVLENWIGNRQSDTSLAVVRASAEDALGPFLVGTGNGSLEAGSVLDIEDLGNAYKARLSITPTEALEAIILDVLAERQTS
jgi:hypothetical protein